MKAQLTYERRVLFESAYLNMISISAGTHGSKEAVKILVEGMSEPKDKNELSEEEIAFQAKLAGKSVEFIKAKLKAGWKPQMRFGK